MRKLSLIVALVLFAAWIPVQAGEEKKKGDEPSEAHKAMAKFAGEYTTASKFTGPDGKVIESKGTSKLAVILDGRFIKEENSGTLFGKPVSGFKLFGFNNSSGKYESVWTYTGSTGMMVLVGDKTGDKTVEFTGTAVMGKGMKANFTIVYTIIDDNSFTVDLTGRAPDGGKGPTLSTTYTRKQ